MGELAGATQWSASSGLDAMRSTAGYTVCISQMNICVRNVAAPDGGEYAMLGLYSNYRIPLGSAWPYSAQYSWKN